MEHLATSRVHNAFIMYSGLRVLCNTGTALTSIQVSIIIHLVTVQYIIALFKSLQHHQLGKTVLEGVRPYKIVTKVVTNGEKPAMAI